MKPLIDPLFQSFATWVPGPGKDDTLGVVPGDA